MKYDPGKHHRRSLRLKYYNYGQAGAYFVTICAQHRECIFGDIVDGGMKLNGPGLMARKWWLELENKFNNVEIDEYIIMPNHMHGIIFLVGADLCVCPDCNGRPDRNRIHPNKKGAHTGAPLHRIIQWFKTMTTNEYLRNVHINNWQRLNRKLWQRNYHERVIRDEFELNRIRQYIINNPMQWDIDKENPANI